MINEFADFEKEPGYAKCRESLDPTIQCVDPLKTFDSPNTLAESCIALGSLFVGFYVVSLIVMSRLSRKYE